MSKFDETIKSISYNQHEILYNIMQMHNGGEPFECDPTYSIGNFYGDFKVTKSDGTVVSFTIPQPKYKFDVDPQVDDVERIEPLGHWPLPSNSVSSICEDLPFVISVGPSLENGNEGSNIISKRFASYYPRWEMYRSYSWQINEAFRVLKNDGILVFKCQNVISGGQFLCTEEFSWLEAIRAGFCPIDRFTLLAKTRLISGKVKNQQHARNFSSVFWVFKKGGKKIEDYYRWMEDGDEKQTLQKMLNCGKHPHSINP